MLIIMINKRKANKNAEKLKPIRIQQKKANKNAAKKANKNSPGPGPEPPTPVPAGTGHWLRRLRRRSYPLRHPVPSPNASHWGVYPAVALRATAIP